MHELTIVSSVVETVMESLAPYPGARVVEVRLRVGALSAVIEDSLQFCFGIASIRDGEVIAAADAAGIAMVMAGGERHFRH